MISENENLLAIVKRWIYRPLLPGYRHPFWLFGGMICVHGGKWADIALWRTWLVVSWKRKRPYAYLSRDGTPSNATWGIGSFRND